MKKIFLYLMIGISSISYAQTIDSQESSSTTNEQKNSIKKGTWTVELSSGFRSEIFESSDSYSFHSYKSGNKLSAPQIEAAVWYGLTNYFAIESGLAYVKYRTNWDVQYYESMHQHKMYSALQIPLRARFSIPMAKSKFHFFTSTGMVFQFPLQKSTSYWDMWMLRFIKFEGIIDSKINGNSQKNYTLSTLSPFHSFNILLNAKIGFIYQFDFGLGISIFGEYYKGLRNMVYINAQYVENLWSSSISSITYKSKGDYWNTGIGVSYSFKKDYKILQ